MQMSVHITTLAKKSLMFTPINMGDLVREAHVTHLTAICNYKEDGRTCGRDAIYTQRFEEDGTLSPRDSEQIVLGAQNTYAPRCHRHYVCPK